MNRARRNVVIVGNPLDEELEDLVYALNALPGIQTFESCFGHGRGPTRIWIRANSSSPRNVGLFFLARCTDDRYSTNKWDIHLDISDMMDGDILPLNYVLESKGKGEEAKVAISDLLSNLDYHLNHKGFLKEYKIDLKDFWLVPVSEASLTKS